MIEKLSKAHIWKTKSKETIEKRRLKF
jgi:hypothetical protein